MNANANDINATIYSKSSTHELNKTKKTIIFIHGSPGSHKVFKKYLNDKDLQTKYNLVSIDRPNYGKSDRFKKQIDMNQQAQTISNHLLKILRTNELNNKIYIMSHSYGAPLSILVANLLGDIDSLILIAGPYNPKYNMIRWYNRVAQWLVVQGIIGKMWRTSNEEMLILNQDLTGVEKALTEYNGTTYFIHGAKDTLVPIKHAIWANELRQEYNKNTVFIELPSNHFVVRKKFKFIRNFILTLE